MVYFLAIAHVLICSTAHAQVDGVRLFSASTNYSFGDTVTWGGNQYKAAVASGPGTSSGVKYPDSYNGGSGCWKFAHVSAGSGSNPQVTLHVGSGSSTWCFADFNAAWKYVRDAVIDHDNVITLEIDADQTFSGTLDLSHGYGERIRIAAPPATDASGYTGSYPTFTFSSGGIQILRDRLGTSEIFDQSFGGSYSGIYTGIHNINITGPGSSYGGNGIYVGGGSVLLTGHVVISGFGVGVEASGGGQVVARIDSVSSADNEVDTSTKTVKVTNCTTGFSATEASSIIAIGTMADTCTTGYWALDTSTIGTAGAVANNCAIGIRAHAATVKVFQASVYTVNGAGPYVKKAGVFSTNSGTYLCSYLASFGGKVVVGYNWRHTSDVPSLLAGGRLNVEGYFDVSGTFVRGTDYADFGSPSVSRFYTGTTPLPFGSAIIPDSSTP